MGSLNLGDCLSFDLESRAHLEQPKNYDRRQARIVSIEEHSVSPFPTPAQSSTFNIFDERYLSGVKHRLVDLELRLDIMDKYGIGAQILSLNQPSAQAFTDLSKSVKFCQQANEFTYLTYCKPYPDRFFAFAALPTQNGAAAAKELRRCVEEYNFVGAMINGFTNVAESADPLYLDDPQFDELWEVAQELDKAIFIHPRVPLEQNMVVLKDTPIFHGAPYGFGRETAEHVLRIMYAGVFDRFPRLKICLGHLGEGLSFILPRTDSTFRLYNAEAQGPKQRSFMHYFRQNIYINTSGYPRTSVLQSVLSESSSSHIMFAVDYPYESIAEVREWFDTASIPEDTWKDIAYRNAIRIFGLPLDYD